MPSTGVLPQKQKSSAPGVLIGQRHRLLLSSNSEQRRSLAIGSSPERLCVLVDGLQHPILQPGNGFSGALPGGLVRARFGPGRSARQLEAGEFADHRVAADADAGGDLAAGEAGIKMTLQ